MTGKFPMIFSGNFLGSYFIWVLVRQGKDWMSCDSRNDPDCMTSPNSTTVYSEPDLNRFLGYVGYIKQVGGNHGFSACVVGKSSVLLHRVFLTAFSGRLMAFFSKFLFVRGWSLGH